MSDIYVTIPTSISRKYTVKYFDSHQKFGLLVNISCNFLIINSNFADDASPINEGINTLRSDLIKEDATIIINDEEYTHCRVTSLNFPDSYRNVRQEASLSFEYDETLTEPGTTLYDLANYVVGGGPIDSFSQNWSYEEGSESIDFSRDFSIKLAPVSDSNVSTLIQDLSLVAKTLFLEYRKQYNFNYANFGIADPNLLSNKTFVTEDIDEVNLSISFTEKYSIYKNLGSLPYSYSRTCEINKTLGSFTTKKWTSTIKSYEEVLEENIREAVTNESDELKSIEVAPFVLISLTKDVNILDGSATISAEFSDAPNNNQFYRISYTVSRTKNGINYDYSLSGDIIGKGRPLTERLQKCKDAYNALDAQYILEQFFNEIITDGKPLTQTASSYSESLSSGSVSFSFSFTNNENYTSSGCFRIKNIEIRQSFSLIKKSYIDTLDGGFARLVSNNTELGEINVDVSGTSGPLCCLSYSSSDLQNILLDEAIDLVNSEVNQINNLYHYITSIQTKYDDFSGEYSASVSLTYIAEEQ